MNKELFNQAATLALNHFQKTRVLSFEELLYLLKEEWPLEKSHLPSLTEWYEQLVHCSYLKEVPPTLSNLFIGEKHYWENHSKEQFPLSLKIEDHLQLHFEILCHREKITWNANQPYASFLCQTHKKTFRFTLIHQSISPQQTSKLFVRKIQETAFPLEDFLPPSQKAFFQNLIWGKKNILICGATGSGKTSFLSSLLQEIPESEHTLILEDTKELIPPQNTTELLAKEQKGKTLVDFCYYALRMSPDRLIIGEMRADEIIPFLLMMNTGHRGLMSTVHANSAVDALHRCAFLFTIYGGSPHLKQQDILKLITKNIDYVAHLQGGKVTDFIKVLGSERENCFFEKISLDETVRRSIQ